MDDTPSYFVREGYIYKHTQSTTYRSAGFTCGEPAHDTKVCEATRHNVNQYLKYHNIYSYDESKWLKPYISNYKDAFDNPIFEGDIVLIMDCWGDGSFKGYVKGEVTGFTKEYVKIKPISHDRLNVWFDESKIEIMRKPYRIVII